ncbi:hypothetical protein L207DRAFT_508738 [Hyaloscypha variabilis F]|uniref:Zn(2)-C6 fungal-type domain-containing protein n=1 Tax=Hyaloscypha variabilis (strain UAMH 11265 / GT02V1 / F) TaxID=1149755 RepID=A0A2J6RZN6_HYAVF|nr:hypothetical protein L207DRAFT_508738 [Hyaloscypha variabilis F]
MEGARRKFSKPPVKLACLGCRASRIRCDGRQDCKNCLDKGRECVYTKSNRGGARPHRAKAESVATSSSRTSPTLPSNTNPFNLDEGLYYHSIFQPDGSGLENIDGLMDPGIIQSDGSFIGMDMGLDLSTISTDEQSSNVYHFDDPSVGQPLLSNSTSFTPEKLETTQSLKGKELDSSSNMGNMSTADMFRAISDLEQLKRPLSGTRHYGSDAAILNAYYIHIHPVFPILPPPVWEVVADNPLSEAQSLKSDYRPYSPICLAISATLALIPLSPGPASKSPEAKTARRNQAHDYATSCLNSIDVETELIESMISPQDALQKHFVEHGRAQFHPRVPLSLESILALLVLTVYEYAQRGNMTKMRARAGQALVMALDMGLCDKEDGRERYAETRRRAWWMTYACVCHGAIVKNAPLKSLVIDLYDSRFQIGYPVIAADPGVFEFFIKAQQAIIVANQFTNDLKVCLEDNIALSERNIYERQTDLENLFETLCHEADQYAETNPSNLLADADEAVVGKGLRAISRIRLNSARIKIHRYTAFRNIPIFLQKHCDLPTSLQPLKKQEIAIGKLDCCDTTLNSTSSTSAPPSEAITQLDCCSNDTPTPSAPNISPPKDDSGPMILSCCTPEQPTTTHSPRHVEDPNTPFTRAKSTKICHTAGLSIVQSFYTLPYPSPLVSPPSSYLLPRSMPVFACCAMQSAYALLMLCHKTYLNRENADDDIVVQGFMSHLRQALGVILESLDNYAAAYEALDGMRAQIQESLDSDMFL